MASQTFRSLQERNARIFFLGLLVSNIGMWVQLTASSALVYRITGRSTVVGLTIATQFLPMLLFGAWAGAVADRVNRRKMTLITQSLLAIQALTLGVLDLTGHVGLPALFVLSGIMGLINAMDNPARRGFVIELVDPANISNAMSLNTAVMTGSRIFGPALAAVLTAKVGTGWCFIINAISFAAILGALLSLDKTKLRPAVTAARGGKPVREALSFVRHDRRVLMVFAVLTVSSTFAFNYSVSFLRLSDKRFGNEDLFGWFLASSAVGSLIGSLQIAKLELVRVRNLLLNAALLSVSGLAMAWSPNSVFAFACSVPLGIGGAGLISSSNAIAQQECPPAMRSRLLALVAVAFLGSTPIGSPITGWIADHIGAEWSLAYGSIATLAVVGFAVVMLARSRTPTELRPNSIDEFQPLDPVV
jgi:MFS family permease